MNTILAKLNGFIDKYQLHAFKDVAIFAFILILFHFLWRFFIGDLLNVPFIANSAAWLSHQVFLASKVVVKTLGFGALTYDHYEVAGRTLRNVFIYPENNGYVSVNLSCSGLKQFYQFGVLILLYPGPWKHKLWFIPMGLFIIHLVNIFRIVGMNYVTLHFDKHWDFVHDYVFRPFFYVVMFFLWVWWNEKFYHKSKKKETTA